MKDTRQGQGDRQEVAMLPTLSRLLWACRQPNATIYHFANLVKFYLRASNFTTFLFLM